MTPSIALIVRGLCAFGMLVVIPLGLHLTGDPRLARMSRRWPVPAAAGAISLVLPRGAVAGVLAAGYAVGAAVLAAFAIGHLVRRGRSAGRLLTPYDVALCTALAAPTVAATALIAERSGRHLFGFSLDILSLTVAHFHYAGFAAALIAGLGYRDRPTPAAAYAAITVPVGLAAVLLGFFLSPTVSLIGTVTITSGMCCAGWVAWRAGHPGTGDRDRLAAALLTISSLTLVVTMLLAVDWALGRAYGVAHLSLSWMAATHGVANALGFAACGLIGLHRLAVPSRSDELTYAEVGATRHGDLPSGYRHLRHRRVLGSGDRVFAGAGEALMTFAMHRRAGILPASAGARAVPGMDVAASIGVGPIRVGVPCRVVWCVDTPDAIGFAYGTRTGHPECGEESFTVTREADGSVVFTIVAFSRPAAWYSRAAGPLGNVLQDLVTRRYARTLHGLATNRRPG